MQTARPLSYNNISYNKPSTGASWHDVVLFTALYCYTKDNKWLTHMWATAAHVYSRSILQEHHQDDTNPPHFSSDSPGRAVRSSCSSAPSSCCLNTIAQTMWFNEPSLRTIFFTVFSDKKLVHSRKDVSYIYLCSISSQCNSVHVDWFWLFYYPSVTISLGRLDSTFFSRAQV